ncbi:MULTISPECIES: hypothetical protein [unclassified Microcoleus]|uniref:hypothetical protein n=1 Tax=unclassified Microcoleus TaxID=2642155 RepID=UPI002FD3C4D1
MMFVCGYREVPSSVAEVLSRCDRLYDRHLFVSEALEEDRLESFASPSHRHALDLCYLLV